jgi:glycolate oxidase FAD binding subunit
MAMQQETYTLPDGLTLSDVARPASVEDVADILRSATERGTWVVPVGGGTSLGTGNAVQGAFLGIDLRGLSGVRQYEPTDLTASFWAGTTVADVMAVLADQGQELPLDTPQADRGTIGGLVATAFSGPRRLGSGTLKDLLIGCGYVRGDGLVAKAGGMLVKNVSGFEITRLLHGSWGSLGVLTSVNLKVVPQPKADATFTQHFSTMAEAFTAQSHVLEGNVVVYASVIERDADVWALRLRLLGRQGSLQAQVRSLFDQLGNDGDLIEGDTFWRSFNNRWATDDGAVRIVIGARPHAMQAIAAEIASWEGIQNLAVSLSTGSLRVVLDPDTISFDGVTDILQSMQGGEALTWIVESAPSRWKANGSVWGPQHPGMSLMRSIKHEFDPAGILNLGRLFI